MRSEISVSEKPFFLKQVRTKSGFNDVSNCTFSDALEADSGDNPHELMRYETVKDCFFELVAMYLTNTGHTKS